MFTIYGRPNCVWCNSAKEFLHIHNKEYTYYEIGTDLTRDEFLEKFPGLSTVPVIICPDGALRGYNQLVDYIVDSDLTAR